MGVSQSGELGAAQSGAFGLRRLVAGATHLSGGAAVGHLMTLAAMPFIAKVYGPAAFGIWAGWLAFSGVVGSVACLRYDTAIALPESDAEALHVAAAAVFSALIVSLVAGAILLGVWDLGLPGPWKRLGGHLAWVPPGALVIALVAVATQWLARMHHVSALAMAKVWSSGGTALAKLALGWLGSGTGLILGDIVGRTVGIWRRVRRACADQAANLHAMRYADVIGAMRRYRAHSMWLTPTALVNAIGLHVPALLMINWYGSTVGGQYSLVQRLMAVPMAFLGQSIAQLFLPQMTKALRTHPPAGWRMFLGVSAVLATGAVVLIGISWTVEERWVVQILGSKWEGVGRFLLPCATLVGMQLIVSPVSQTAIALGAQRWFSLWVLVWATASIAGMYCGHKTGSPEGAVWGLATASGAGYGVLWLGLLWGLWRVAHGQPRQQK